MKKVFLGGTCNNSDWRDALIPDLKIDYFNPVVPEWNDDAYQKEIEARANCDYCLYVITAKMKGMYSIAEVIDDSNKRPEKTIFCFSEHDGPFDPTILKSLNAIGKMIEKNQAAWCKDFSEISNMLR